MRLFMLSVDFLAPEDERRVIKFSGGHTIPFTMGSASSVWPPGVFEYLGKVGRYLGRIRFFALSYWVAGPILQQSGKLALLFCKLFST